MVLSIFVFFSIERHKFRACSHCSRVPERRIESLPFHLPNWSFRLPALVADLQNKDFGDKNIHSVLHYRVLLFLCKSNWCVPWKITRHLQCRGCKESSKSKKLKMHPKLLWSISYIWKVVGFFCCFFGGDFSKLWLNSFFVISPGRWNNIMCSEKKKNTE